MEGLHMDNTSQDNSNITSNNNNNENAVSTQDLVVYIIISVGLLLTLVAIYALYSQVRNGQVAPIYVINLLITAIIQLCSITVRMTESRHLKRENRIVYLFHRFSALASVGFMLCIALERYLVVAWPLWYRFRRTIKTSVVVCVVVWVFTFLFHLTFYLWVNDVVYSAVSAIFYLLPFPLFIFCLGGTLKALSASTVPSDEKRRIVGVLVLVLLIYTLLFMPRVIWLLSEEAKKNRVFYFLFFTFVRFSPLADLALYVFMRKGIIDKLLASVCCCRMDSNDISRSSGNDDTIHTVSSV